MIEFHKIWIEQCEAATAIQHNWGVRRALEYLVGEKFIHYIREAHAHRPFADELPRFAAEVRRLFDRADLLEFLAELSDQPARRLDDDPVWAAQEVVAIKLAHDLLLG